MHVSPSITMPGTSLACLVINISTHMTPSNQQPPYGIPFDMLTWTNSVSLIVWCTCNETMSSFWSSNISILLFAGWRHKIWPQTTEQDLFIFPSLPLQYPHWFAILYSYTVLVAPGSVLSVRSKVLLAECIPFSQLTILHKVFSYYSKHKSLSSSICIWLHSFHNTFVTAGYTLSVLSVGSKILLTGCTFWHFGTLVLKWLFYNN